ncbi:MAG TPA: RES family NAD+ phosphorylase [Candidatus Limnocylindrales bacterium]|nr:RES family NAD+ phosphorylase [Candidatus Limnocylindrales bacterium]
MSPDATTRAGRKAANGRTAGLDPALLTSFHGVAYCHVPADEPIRLERLVSADGSDDRWNRPGEPTLYLACDLAIAVAELGRHADLYPGMPPYRRRLLALSVAVDDLADLRRDEVRAAVGIDVAQLRDRDVARDVAERLRREPDCNGLIVPSVAFLDDPARGNLVVFMDRFGAGIHDIHRGTADAGLIELRPAIAR